MGQRRLPILLFFGAACVQSALGQEAGWHYSPLPGEGDRAAMGCGLKSTPQDFSCLVVRCEDDFSVGVHIHTSRPQGDAGQWAITIDKETREVLATAGPPYGAVIAGDVSWVLDGLRNGAVAYLEPGDATSVPANHIALDGSLYTINRALALCAPRAGRPIEPIGANGV